MVRMVILALAAAVFAVGLYMAFVPAEPDVAEPAAAPAEQAGEREGTSDLVDRAAEGLDAAGEEAGEAAAAAGQAVGGAAEEAAGAVGDALDQAGEAEDAATGLQNEIRDLVNRASEGAAEPQPGEPPAN